MSPSTINNYPSAGAAHPFPSASRGIVFTQRERMRRAGARAAFDQERTKKQKNREEERNALMATLEKAIELAARAHAGQKDKQNLPYILHPLRVMMRVEGEEAQMVAVLHDTIEDTDLTEDDLRRAGFSEAVIAGVLACTHRRG